MPSGCDFLPVERHIMDKFQFVAESVTVAHLRKIHADAAKRDERIGLVIVTKSGNEDEPLLGLLTIWDIPVEEGTATRLMA